MAKCAKCEHPREAHNLYGKHDHYITGACLYCDCPCIEFAEETPKEYHFDFVATFPDFPDSGEEMAKGVMNLVVQFVETFHGQVGGGFNENAE